MQRLTFHADRLIRDCASWQDFWAAAATLSPKQKGDFFERLVQLFLLTKPKYKTALSAVWLAKSEVPADVRKRLKLPLTDEGIDLIAQTSDGKFWAIQAKFKSDPAKPQGRFTPHALCTRISGCEGSADASKSRAS